MEDISKTTDGTDPQHSEIAGGAGQVVVEEAYITTKGKNYDIMNFVVGFVLFEDMYSNFMSGEAVIVDAAGLIVDMRLTGSEFITLSFRTRQTSAIIKKSFNIFAVKNRAATSTDREQAYTLHFTSGENVINNNIAISKKFKGRTDAIVGDIFKQYLSIPRYVSGPDISGSTPLIVTGGPHTSSTAFVPTFWSPTKCLNYLASFSVGSKGQAPNYLFFETNKNFFFASIEDMIAMQRNQNVIFDTYVYSPSKNVVQNITNFSYQFPEIRKGYSIVEKMSVMNMFDTLEGQDRGFYGSTVHTFDTLLKEWRQFAYIHSDGYARFNHMQDFTISGNTVSSSKQKNTRPFGNGIFDGVNSKRTFRTKQYDSYPELRDPMFQTWMPQRNSLLTQMNQWKIYIDVAGRSDIEVGRLVNFLYPKMKTSDKFELDPQMSGLYMVTAVKHAVTRQEYTMTLELTKDSFMEPV